MKSGRLNVLQMHRSIISSKFCFGTLLWMGNGLATEPNRNYSSARVKRKFFIVRFEFRREIRQGDITGFTVNYDIIEIFLS